MAALGDAELAAKTGELRQRLLAWEQAQGSREPAESAASSGNGSGGGSSSQRRGLWLFGTRGGAAATAAQPRLLGGMPEEIVVEAFAVVREAAHRVLGMRHYDVQLVRCRCHGAAACHPGLPPFFCAMPAGVCESTIPHNPSHPSPSERNLIACCCCAVGFLADWRLGLA
jgi:hypothetical protein